MKTRVTHIILVAALCLNLTHVFGEETKPIAVVELVCKGSKGPSADEESATVDQLKTKMLTAYFTSLGPERKIALDAKSALIFKNPDEYLRNFTPRTREFDKKTKVYTCSAQAEIDVSKVNMLIDSGLPGDKNPIVFIFVARRQIEVETKSPKVTTGIQKISSEQKEAASQNRAGESSVSVGSKSAESVTTVSSVTKTADRVVYIVEDNAKASIDRTMTKVFVDRGFDTASAADLIEATKGVFNPDKLQKDFEVSSQFSLENQRLATKACREAGAPLLAYGTLTIGVQRPDSVNNKNVIVNVIVDAQILDCRKALTIKVGSIGALQVEGVGADQTQAENAGLALAASKAAQVLSDQLRIRGIR